MPRPDGTLYNYEKDALKPKVEKKPKAAKEKKPKAVAELKVLPDLPKGPANHRMRRYIEEKKPDMRKRLTPEDVETVISHIKQGLSIESALILIGVTRRTLERWRARNPALQAKFEQAEIEWERAVVGKLAVFANGDAKVGQWLLERRLSRTWAPVGKQELTGKGGKDLGSFAPAAALLGRLGGNGDGIGEPTAPVATKAS